MDVMATILEAWRQSKTSYEKSDSVNRWVIYFDIMIKIMNKGKRDLSESEHNLIVHKLFFVISLFGYTVTPMS